MKCITQGGLFSAVNRTSVASDDYAYFYEISKENGYIFKVEFMCLESMQGINGNIRCCGMAQIINQIFLLLILIIT